MKEQGKNRAFAYPGMSGLPEAGDNADNKSGTIGTDNKPDTAERRGPTERQQHWRRYNNVTLHLDEGVHRQLRIMAVRENTTLTSLVSEAIAAWLKWLAKESRMEAKEEELAQKTRELEGATALLASIRAKRKKAKRR